jgi:hypothetical protein
VHTKRFFHTEQRSTLNCQQDESTLHYDVVMMILTLQMASSQVVYQADYEDASSGSAPYRYSTYTATCLNGRTATRCDTRAYLNVCSNCVSKHPFGGHGRKSNQNMFWVILWNQIVMRSNLTITIK